MADARKLSVLNKRKGLTDSEPASKRANQLPIAKRTRQSVAQLSNQNGTADLELVSTKYKKSKTSRPNSKSKAVSSEIAKQQGRQHTEVQNPMKTNPTANDSLTFVETESGQPIAKRTRRQSVAQLSNQNRVANSNLESGEVLSEITREQSQHNEVPTHINANQTAEVMNDAVTNVETRSDQQVLHPQKESNLLAKLNKKVCVTPNPVTEVHDESNSVHANLESEEVLFEIENEENDQGNLAQTDDDRASSHVEQITEKDAKLIWLFEREFEDKSALDEFLKQENCWSLLKKVSLQESVKTQLRCNKVKRRGHQCANGLYYLESKDPAVKTIKLFKRNADHDCEQSKNKVDVKATEATRKFILEQKQLGNKLEGILLKLRQQPNLSQPSKAHVKHIASYHSPKVASDNFVSISQMEAFVKENSAIPDDQDHGFVVNFECSSPRTPDDQKFFRIFYSTKRLLSNALKSKVIHADGTHKIIVQGYPILVIGISDCDKRFHLCGIGITSSERTEDFKFLFESLQIGVINACNEDINPKALVADAAAAITNSFDQAFDDIEHDRVYCFAHMMTNVETQSFDRAENKELIKDDLRSLQLAPSKNIFEAGWKLLIAKWSKKEARFVKYFQANHINTNGNWYAGYADRTPQTNNCLETFNRLLKQQQTFYLHKPLHEFMVQALLILRERSTQYVQDKEPPATVVTVTDELRVKAWQYAESEKSMVPEQLSNGELSVYVFAGDNMTQITLNDVRAQEKYKAKRFDDFVKNAYSIYKMTFADETVNDWIHAKCTCPAYAKDYMCKHILAVAYRMEALSPPDSLLKQIETPAPKKNPVGRPRKATKALIRD